MRISEFSDFHTQIDWILPRFFQGCKQESDNSFEFILPQEYNINMIKTIHHGSTHIIKKPLLGSGHAFNDFGIGFYCTESESEASGWAVSRNRNGFVSTYSIDCSGLRIIDLCGPQYTLLHWISLLFNYREFDASSRLMHDAKEYISKEFPIDLQGSDCIIGYTADNCFYILTADFLNGRISFQALKQALQEESRGRQFVLKSNRAFDRILYTGYSSATAAEHYPLKYAAELSSLKKAYASTDEKGLFISQMIEEEIKDYDSRLR